MLPEEYQHSATSSIARRPYRTLFKFPARIGIFGASGCGKTVFLMNLLRELGIFGAGLSHADRIIVCCPTEQQLYQLLQDAAVCPVEITNSVDQLPDLDDANAWSPDEHTILITDDLQASSPKELKKLEKFAIRGRTKGCTFINLSQGFFETPKKIRQNLTTIFLAGIRSKLELQRILREYSDNSPIDMVADLYRHATFRPGDFFCISFDATNPDQKFRKNFDQGYQISTVPTNQQGWTDWTQVAPE